MTDSQTIPDAILAAAAELTNATIRNYERNQPAYIARDAIAKAIHDAVMAERAKHAAASEEAGDNMYLTAMWDARSWAKKWGYLDFADRLVEEVNKRAEKSGLSKMKV